MKKVAAVLATVSLIGVGLAHAPTASADVTWDFSGGSFTLSDVAGGSATLTVQSMRVTGATATGRLGLENGGRSSCTTSSFSGLTATFSIDGQYNPCSGTVTFAISPTGAFTVIDSSVYIPTQFLTGPGSGSLQGAGPQLNCTAVTVAGDTATVTWTSQGAPVTQFSVGLVNGQNANIDVAGSATQATVSLAGETPGPVEIAIEADGDSSFIAACPIPAPGKPTIEGVVPAPGGLLTVNYSVAAPFTVQGVEYAIDGGAWTRPGGQAPVAGAGGAFTVTGLAAGSHSVTLRSIGWDSAVTQGDLVTATALPGKASPPNTGAAIGSAPSRPTPVPPAIPTSTVAGTSNGAGSGTNGAVAATTGDAGIDAPCLAADGTLYPNQYSTVGSQHTMAPNTHGMGTAKKFTVVAGALPAGMQLDRTYGVLFGVVTQPGSWVTTIAASFANGTTKTSQFTTRVDAHPQTLQYAAQNIGTVGRGIAIAPTTNAPVSGTTYTLVCGELPAGTRFDSRTGLITGKPTVTVARPTPLRVAERSPAGTAAASFIFVVNKAGATSIAYPAHPHVRVGKRVAIRPTVAGVGDIALFRMWKGKLPTGLHLNRTTGVIGGRIAHRGPTHTIVVVAVTKGGALLTAAPMRISLGR